MTIQTDVPDAPNNRRTFGDGKKDPVRIWMEPDLVQDLDNIADFYGASRGATVRWLIDRGRRGIDRPEPDKVEFTSPNDIGVGTVHAPMPKPVGNYSGPPRS